MQISKLKKAITDELTTMESQFGDMDIKELSLVDRPDRVDINYKTASPIDQRKAWTPSRTKSVTQCGTLTRTLGLYPVLKWRA